MLPFTNLSSKVSNLLIVVVCVLFLLGEAYTRTSRQMISLNKHIMPTQFLCSLFFLIITTTTDAMIIKTYIYNFTWIYIYVDIFSNLIFDLFLFLYLFCVIAKISTSDSSSENDHYDHYIIMPITKLHQVVGVQTLTIWIHLSELKIIGLCQLNSIKVTSILLSGKQHTD